MILVDVHAHMDLEGYEEYGGPDKVIEECAKNNVSAIVANGVDIASNRRILALAIKHKILKPALGIYPMHCLEMIEQRKQEEFDDEIHFIDEQLISKKVIAVGEVGLEYKEIIDINDEKKNIQKECLKKFIMLAKKYDVPIIIHSRKAELDTIELLENEGMKNKKVIMHCFSGRMHLVKRIKDNGWYFSIPAIINRLEHFQQIVNEVPLEQLFTETDSPLLSPIKEKANRPDNVIYGIKKIAEIKKLEPEEVANIIYNNYQRVFL